MKFIGLLKKGRRVFFTLALFILVFVAASIVKIQAAGNVTGWGWGGSEDCDFDKNGFKDGFCGGNNFSDSPANGDGVINGNETGVGWISMNGDNPETPGGADYGVTIPSDTCSGSSCKVTGYAWANASNSPNSSDSQEGNGLGWIDFNPQDNCVVDTNNILEAQSPPKYEADSCTPDNPPGGSAGVFRSGDELTGWARFVGIAQQSVIGNSGGWKGWISMNRSTGGGSIPYGVQISKMDGNARPAGNPAANGTFAWSDELGWIDFSRALWTPPPPSPACRTGRTVCSNNLPSPVISCDKDTDCLNSISCNGVDPTHWTCTNGTETTSPCPALVVDPENGECGDLNGGSFCNLQTVSDSPMLCRKGTPSPDSSQIMDLAKDKYEVTWQCDASNSCGGSIVSCSAKGKKSCGWIETNP